SITEQIEIQETPPLTLNTINLEAATCGQDNGSFELEVQSGTAPYSFNIGNGTNGNAIFTDLAAGSYTVTVVDANGCSNTEQVAIEASEIELSVSIENLQNANCGEENGRFSIVVNNGSAPYTYDLGEGTTNDPNFSNLALGNYEITVNDAAGCSTILEVEIGQGTDPVSGEVVQNLNATCGQSNGSLTVQAVSGVAPFTYDIGFGASTVPLFSNLSQGIYTITITDVNGCQGTLEAAVDETNPITAETANLQDATCGENNGQFEITVNSGTAPFTYNIGEGVTSSNRFTNLEGGSYNVTITDANSCSATIQVSIEQTPPVSTEVQELVATTCGEDNGSFSISASGGVAPYQYNIGNGASENNTFFNLAGGNYEVTIIDSEGCQRTQSVEIPSSSDISARLIGPTGAYCGQDNGTFAVIAEGGVEPYRYDIGNGITSDPNFGNLAAGDYVVTITDAQNCTTTLNARVDFTSVVEVSVRKENDFCGNGEGSITLVPDGGTAPYTYNIGEGPSSSNTFEGVFPGTYNITVTDAAGCEAVTTTTITATSDLNVAILSRKRPTCGNNNGRLVVSAGSGVAPYQFNIGNGNVSSNTFEGLAPGEYTVTITDAVGCSATTIPLELPAESEAPTAIITNKLDVSCAGNDGQFTVEASGGLAPYTYTVGGAPSTNPIFEEMPAGDYEVTITDANGCEIIESVSIEGETAVSASISEIQDEDCDAENASFLVNASGGTAPYRYDIGNGLSSNNNFENLSSGVYDVTIIDSRDCQTTEQVTIESINDLSASVGNQSAASCAVADGAFTIIPSGGTEPYRYNIGNGFTASPRFENLASGSYNLTISDANGCTFQTAATVEGTDAPEGSVTTLGDAICGKDNGSVSLLAFGGRSPYTYDIGNGSGLSNDFEDLAAGDYIATITDANGCASSVSFSIGMIGTVPTASFIIDTSGLEIELENTSSGADSSSWDLGDGVIYDGNTVIHEYEDGGTYTICLTTMNECGSTTECQSITLASAVKKADLGGMIFTELDLPVSDVNMLCTGMDTIQTNLEGLYSFDNLLANSTYEVQPSKTDDVLNGLSTFDIFLINNHILAKERLDSPYKIIAADLNLSGTVTTFDVVMLRKLLLGISDELPNG
ncbi:MAG: PKD domain-containing protein, partial [Bacteroidota bacterium]